MTPCRLSKCLSCPECDAFALSGGTNTLICTACNAHIEANFLPLFLISGASGTGKSTLVCLLRPLLPDCVVVGGDLLVDVTNRDRQSFLGRWLRVAYATAQSGHPIVIAGVIEKTELDAHVDRSLVGQIHVIGLHTNEEVRVARLQARPRWAKHSAEKRAARIAEHVDFAKRVAEDAELFSRYNREHCREHCTRSNSLDSTADILSYVLKSPGRLNFTIT